MKQDSLSELNQLFSEFQRTWPRERIATMKLDEYTKLHGKESFCYWLEKRLDLWGSIWGGSSEKFGIYEHSDKYKENARVLVDGQYTWYRKYGTNPNEAFEQVKQRILDIIDAVRSNELGKIDQIDLGDAYKWKIAFQYQSDITNSCIVPIFKREWLCQLTSMPPKTNVSEMQKLLIEKKPQEQSIKEYSDELGKGLWGVPHYWVFAPGEKACMWQDCLDNGIMSIGWDDMDNLLEYKTKGDIKQALRDLYKKDSSYRNDGLCCWEFANVLKEGDIVYAKNGTSSIIGRGIVTSDYSFDIERGSFKHTRKVDWTHIGHWNQKDSKIAIKTLTDITKHKEYTKKLELLITGNDMKEDGKNSINIKDMFLDFLMSCVRSTGKSEVLSKEASKNYVNYLDSSRLFDYNPSKWKDIKSIFDIHDIDSVVKIYDDLMEDEDFKIGDNKRFRQTALGHYITFLRSNKYFTHKNAFEQSANDAIVDITKYGKYIQLLKEQHNIILTGAPGTGKTYLAKAIAKAMNAEIGFVQFHPSYDYTDFVEGLRPNQDSDGNMGFERQDGIFKEFCSKALKNLLDSEKSAEVQNREATALIIVDEYLADCSENNIHLKTSSKGKAFDIYDTNDKCIKIRIPDNEKANDIRISRTELIELLVACPHIESGSDTCKFFNRQFRTQGDTYLASIYIALADKMKNASSNVEPAIRKDYVFIIDEINRGEINKIFGELFFSIDPGYRGQTGLVQTQYQKLVPQDDLFAKGFYVPKNVYIIGTMNDIDRSVESMDFAMRRRFTWVEIKPMDNAEMLDGKSWSEEALKRMNLLNKEICMTEGLGEAFQVGPSYFTKLATNGADFSKLWDMNIKPLLQEYLRGFRDATKILTKFEIAYNGQPDNQQPETTEVIVEEAD